MTEPREWDYPATMRPRRRRPRIETVEILPPEQPERHIRVTVHHQRHQAPPWIVPLAIIALLLMISPFGLVVALVMLAVLVSAHPTVAISVAGSFVLVVAIGVHQRRKGVPF
jgi:hypothetical protein